VDKVAAVLQQVVVVHGSQKGLNLNLLDVTDIHEDNLALFVDQGTSWVYGKFKWSLYHDLG
jgi:hypothetical protein